MFAGGVAPIDRADDKLVPVATGTAASPEMAASVDSLGLLSGTGGVVEVQGVDLALHMVSTHGGLDVVLAGFVFRLVRRESTTNIYRRPQRC